MKAEEFFNSPLDAGIVSLAAGGIFLYIGITLRYVISGLNASTLQYLEADLGILWGVLTIAASLLLMLDWNRHRIYGTVIIVSSILSWVGDNGGFLVGFVIGLLGGIMAFTWHPSKNAKVQKANLRS
ncbi:MAG: DUF6114 domain-containing protein [Thermoplasmataceae archaeon]